MFFPVPQPASNFAEPNKCKKMRKFINYCKESYLELTKKVTWPTWQKLQSSALLVMLVTVIVAVALWIVDFAFQHLMTVIYTL